MRYLSFFFVLSILWGCTGVQQSDREVSNLIPKILVVHSTHSDDLWAQQVNQGIERAFRDRDIEVKTIYMDTKRNTGIEYKIQAGEVALDSLKVFEPDILLTVGDNAQMYFARGLRKHKDLKIVFCGVSGQLETYGFPTRNSTGVIMRPNIFRGLQLMRELFKTSSVVNILTDDSDASIAFLDILKKQRSSLGYTVNKVISTNSLFDWENEVKSGQSDILVIYSYNTLLDADIQPVNPAEIINWTTLICKRPILSFSEFSVAGGALLGVVESGDEQGFLAANKAIKILEGADPTDVSIETSPQSMVCFNKTTAEFLLFDMGPIATEVNHEHRGGGLVNEERVDTTSHEGINMEEENFIPEEPEMQDDL